MAHAEIRDDEIEIIVDVPDLRVYLRRRVKVDCRCVRIPFLDPFGQFGRYDATPSGEHDQGTPIWR